MGNIDTTERSQRFLAIFKELDNFLRRQLGPSNSSEDGRPLPFYGVIDALVAKGNVPVMLHAQALRRYGSLRNAIIHWGPQAYAIAEPHESTIKTFESIRKALMAPPRLLDNFNKPVELAQHSDSLISAMQTMKAKNFSQMPVYRANSLLGVLTADTIVRWLAQFTPGQTDVINSPVGPVLAEAEDPNNFAILPETATVFDALNIFDSRRSISALLVTGSGGRDTRPLTILTIFDYPRLAAKVVQA